MIAHVIVYYLVLLGIGNLATKLKRNLDSYLKLDVVIQSASPFKGVNKKGGA